MEKKCKEYGQVLPKKNVIEIKHKYTGKVIKVVEAETLGNANLRGANLGSAD